VNLLVDTHVLVWYGEGNPRLSERIRVALDNPHNAILISIATFWEFTIKESCGKLRLKSGVRGLYDDWVRFGGCSLLEVRLQHLETLRELPWLHRDPFDRLLVAQALATDSVLVSQDPGVFGVFWPQTSADLIRRRAIGINLSP